MFGTGGLSASRGRRRLVFLISATIVAIPAGRGGDPQATRIAAAAAFTSPSRMAELAPATAGRIAEFLAAEGAQVSAGQPLVRLEDELERVRVAAAALAAQSTLEIDLARVQLESAQRELVRVLELHKGSAATAKEVSDARLGVESARLEMGISRRRHEAAQHELELARIALARRQILAPFSGVVISHLKECGESLEEPEAALVLAQLDPLQIAVDLPLAAAHAVQVGGELDVAADDSAYGRRVGRIVHVSAMADGASRTRRVKVDVPNPDGAWIAGMKVHVSLAPAAHTSAAPTSRVDSSSGT